MEKLILRDIERVMSSDMKASKKTKAIRVILNRWHNLLNGHEL